MVMREATAISERRACQLVGLSRTVLHYVSKAQPENEQLQARLVELAGERRRFGYRRLHALVRREGVRANHKRRLFVVFIRWTSGLLKQAPGHWHRGTMAYPGC